MSGGRITYADAIASLTAMFPTADVSVIEAVLEMHRGAMEPTIEQLLTLTDTSARPSAQNSPGPSSPSLSHAPAPALVGVGVPVGHVMPPPMQGGGFPPMFHTPGMVLQQPPMMMPAPGMHAPEPVHDTHQQPRPGKLPVRRPLPKDFLRLPGVGLPPVGGGPSLEQVRSGETGGPQSAQSAADERLAAMLQNEMFIAELREDPELMEAILRDPAVALSVGIPPELIANLAQQVGYRSHPQHAPGMMYPATGMVGSPSQPAGGRSSIGMRSPDAGARDRSGSGLSGVAKFFGFGGSNPQPSTPARAPGSAPGTHIETADAAAIRSRTGGGISGGAPAPASSNTGGGGWDLRRRLGLMAARFQRNQGGGSTGLGRAGYSSLPTDGTADQLGSDSGPLLPASRADRVRVASQPPVSGPSGMVEIELTETNTASRPPNAGEPPQAAFVIDDEEDEETATLTGGGRRHV